jgi:hypothetical protein
MRRCVAFAVSWVDDRRQSPFAEGKSLAREVLPQVPGRVRVPTVLSAQVAFSARSAPSQPLQDHSHHWPGCRTSSRTTTTSLSLVHPPQ